MKVTAVIAATLSLGACFHSSGDQGRGRIGPPLDAASFAALVDGRVIQSLPPGGGPADVRTEHFLPGQRSCLSDEKGARPGQWRQNGQLICRDYAGTPAGPFCNSYHLRGGALIAFPLGDMRRLPVLMQDWQGIAPGCSAAIRS